MTNINKPPTSVPIAGQDINENGKNVQVELREKIKDILCEYSSGFLEPLTDLFTHQLEQAEQATEENTYDIAYKSAINDLTMNGDYVPKKDLELAKIEAKIEELDTFGEVEFEDVPMDIVRYKHERISELTKQKKEIENDR